MSPSAYYARREGRRRATYANPALPPWPDPPGLDVALHALQRRGEIDMTGVFVLLAVVLGVIAAVWAFVAAKRSHREPGGVEPDHTPPSERQ